MINTTNNNKEYRLSDYVKACKFSYSIYIIIKAAHTILYLLIPLYLSYCVDSLFDNTNTHSISEYAFLFFFLVIVEFVLYFFMNDLNVRLSNKITFQIEFDTMRHVKYAKYEEVNKFNDAYLAQRINNDAVCIGDYVVEKLPGFITDFIIVMSIIIILFRINIVLGLLILGILACFFGVYFFMRKQYYRYNYEMVEAQGNFFSMLSNQIFNVRIIKLNSWYQETDNEFIKNVTAFYNKSVKFLRVHFSITNISTLLSRLSYGLALLLLVVMISEDKVSFGNIAIIIIYVQLILTTVQNMTEFGKSKESYHVSKDRIEELFTLEENQNGEIKLEDPVSIKIERLSSGYGNNPVFRNRNALFLKGSIYLIRGENGSGKSTFVNTILGLLSPISGTVSINQYNISDTDMYGFIKDKIAFTEQEPYLLNGTIQDNLLYGLKNKNDLTLGKYLKEMKLLEFIYQKEDGIETHIGSKNTNLSGGEKQRIAICRSLLKDADILIFDEPTSALDNDSINAFLEEIIARKQNHIIIIISHDRRFVDIADEVIDF